MRNFMKTLTVSIFTVSLAGFVFAQVYPDTTKPSQLRPSERSDAMVASGAWQEGFILKEKVAGTSDQCHMKFPAIQEYTLSSRNPVLEPQTSGDVIDMYGPCNYDPDGRIAVLDQKHEWQHRFEREFHDG